jgi:outer membrane protein assembly factor BamB
MRDESHGPEFLVAGLLVVATLAAVGFLTIGFVRVSAPPAVSVAPVAEESEAPPAKDAITAVTGDWPMYGGTVFRNLANPVARGIPDDFSVQKGKEKHVKWQAALGVSYAYGGPVVAGGKVFVGTNNDRPRDPAIKGDKGVLMCFNEADGKFLWQAVHDKLPDPENNDTPKHGVASGPVVEGNRLWYVSNRCEVVCADVNGDGGGKAKFLWTYDMVKELGVYPCYLAICSPLILGDLVFVVTANGVNPGNHKLPAPKAPSFIALDKNTGKLAWQSALPGENIMEGQWGNPVAAQVAGKWQVIFPGGDGWLYSLEPATGNLLWKFDCNPKKSTFKPGGRGDKSYLVATPVVYENRLYVATGQNPEDGPGVGHLWCIDVTKEPKNADKDLSPRNDNFDPAAPENKESGLVWHYGGPVTPRPTDGSREVVFGRTISTIAVHDGLVYAAELEGYFHCLDARTGKKYWEYDLKDGTWNSPYYVDGKVFLGTDGGDLFVFSHGKELKEPKKITFDNSLKTPPLVANGVLYVTNGNTLYAIAGK